MKNTTTKRLLVVSDLPLLPADAGNKARIWSLMNNLRDSGHEVWFLGLGLEPEAEAALRAAWGPNVHVLPHVRLRQCRPLLSAARRWLFGKRVSRGTANPKVDDWFWPHWDAGIRAFASREQFDSVIVEYVFFSKALAHFDDSVYKIIDTHDVFAGRREKLRSRNIKRLYRYLVDPQEEARGLSRADAVIAIQENEAAYFRELLPESKPVVTVGHTVTIEKMPLLPTGNADILFMASDNALNIDGIHQFLEHSFPKILESIPEPRLLIAGTICRALKIDSPHVKLLGGVENLRDAYALANIVINPMVVGTGLKTKSVEALSFGRALVTTPCGAEGLEDGAGSAFLLARNPEEMARSIVSLLKDHSLTAKLGCAAHAYAAKWNERQMRALENLISPEVSTNV